MILMEIQIGKQMLRVKPCTTFSSRCIGMMFQKKKFSYGFYFPKCSSLHTFFMRQPIDIIMVDQNEQVVAFYPNVNPWRILYCKKAKSCYEFSKGVIASIEIGVKVIQNQK